MSLMEAIPDFECLKWLHQMQHTMKKAKPGVTSLQNLKSFDGETTRGLNVISRYGNHLNPTVREQVQNWRDQCVNKAKEADIAFRLDSINVLSMNRETTQIFVLLYQPQQLLLGHITSTICSKQLSIEFCNYGTILHRNILQFGRTTKASVDTMAGNFGEGMKVEINRLVSLGADITIHTGLAKWTFSHSSHDTELQLHTKKGILMYDTHIIMENLPKEAAIQPHHYLFLQEKKTTVLGGKVEFLLDKKMQQGIYLIGIFVQKTPDGLLPPQIGINITQKNIIEIGRDRNHIREIEITFACVLGISSMPRLVQCGHQTLTETCDICLRYHVLLCFYKFWRAPTISHCWAHAVCSLTEERAVICEEHIMDVFLHYEAPKSIPVSVEESVTHKSDALLLGLQLVTCSKFLVDLLRRSSRCPTLEKEIQAKSDDYIRLPELVTSEREYIPYKVELSKQLISPDYSKVARQIRNLVEKVFTDIMLPEHVRFKDFSIHAQRNSKKVVQVTFGGVKYYLLDFRFFFKERVHVFYRDDDSSFICHDEPCGCVITFAFDSLLSNLPDVDATKLRRKAMRLMMGNISPHIKTPIPKAASAPNISSSHIEATGNTHSDYRMNEQKSNPAAHNIVNDFGDINVNRTLSKPPIDIALGGGESPELPPQIEIMTWDCKPSTVTYIFRGFISRLPFVVDKQKPISPLLPQWSVFSNLLSDMARYVFQFPLLDTTVPKIGPLNLYYEESTTMAFNLDSRLYFNCYYYSPHMPTQQVKGMLFSLFCHELAHNTEGQHNARHSSAMTNLHTKFLPLYVSWANG